MLLTLHSLRTSAIDGKLTSILKANTVANESAWSLFEGWVGIYNGGESRAWERRVPIEVGGLLLPSYFQGIFWKTYKVWQFRHMVGLLLSRDRWRSNWPHCAQFFQLPLGHLGSTRDLQNNYFVFLCAPKCRVLRPQMCSASCWKKCFFPQGLIVAWMVKWHEEQWVLKLCSMCRVPETYQGRH